MRKEMKIETGRLIIRSLQYEDSDILYRIKTDSQVMEFCPDFLDINATQQDMQKYIREFQRLEEDGDIDTWRCYAIENKETGKVMGVLTFSKQNMLHEYELGWMMLGEYTKKGYAYEACRIIIDYLQKYTGIPHIGIDVKKDNAASFKLAKKLECEFPELIELNITE